MGFLKAFSSAVHGALEDQWLEAFSCDALGADILALRGRKMQSARSVNNGNDNIITPGSIFTVPDGACALVTEMGKTIAVYDTPGEHKFTGEKGRGIFGGGGVSDVLHDVGSRVSFGGDAAIVQRVYFINTKEIPGNPFDIPPLAVRLRDKNTTLDMDASVTANGIYSFRITDPVVFFKNVCGNVTSTYMRQDLTAMLRAEIRSTFAPVLAALCADGVRPYELSEQTEQIGAAVRTALQEPCKTLRGIEIVSFALERLTVVPADLAATQSAQRAKMLTDPEMAAATRTAATADAISLADQNPAGAGIGAFAFLQSDAARTKLWHCACGQWCSGNFCEHCGAKAE